MVVILNFSPFQRSKSCASPNRGSGKQMLQHRKFDKNYKQQDWGWLDRWMAAKSWETGSLDTVPPETTPFSRRSEDIGFFPDSVRTRKNNVTTRISAQQPSSSSNQISRSPSSSESVYDEYSPSTSSSSSATVAVTGEEEIRSKPSYMYPTASIKAKQRTCGGGRNLPITGCGRTIVVENRETSNSTCSESSGRLCRDMYQEVPFGRRDRVRCWDKPPPCAAVCLGECLGFELFSFSFFFKFNNLLFFFVCFVGSVVCLIFRTYTLWWDRGRCM